MYHPYFRGKQYELITIRESALRLKESGFVPIIEPVKESLNGLKRSLDAIVSADGEAILIINPLLGHHFHSDDKTAIQRLLDQNYTDIKSISAGILLGPAARIEDILSIINKSKHTTTLIHAGFADGRALAQQLGERKNEMRHVFLEEFCGKLYRKHFESDQRVLVRDGFQRRANREHPPLEAFSDLHATYKEEKMTGFGDFLVVGDDFFETGGPAYAVAIHLTFVDPDKDDEMFICHYVSDRTDTQNDPAGKFAEALSKLADDVQSPNTHIEKTDAVKEFLDLNIAGHYPGLGYVKKLSMQHHIETLSKYFERHRATR